MALLLVVLAAAGFIKNVCTNEHCFLLSIQHLLFYTLKWPRWMSAAKRYSWKEPFSAWLLLSPFRHVYSVLFDMSLLSTNLTLGRYGLFLTLDNTGWIDMSLGSITVLLACWSRMASMSFGTGLMIVRGILLDALSVAPSIQASWSLQPSFTTYFTTFTSQ